MGLPAGENAHLPPPSTAPPPAAPSPPTLPPEALELATRLFDAARAGNTPLLVQYLDAGIPPNLTNHAGDTLLMLAAYHGHAGAAAALLARGADADAVNARGQSILAGAVFKGWDEVVRVLVRAGADVDGGAPTARECARMFGRVGLFEVLGVDEEDGTRLPGFVPGGVGDGVVGG